MPETNISRNILVFSLIIVLFSSGCQIDPFNSVSSTGSGIKMDSFEFSPTSIDDNMKTTTSLVLKNTGTFDAEDVGVVFFGLNDEEWKIIDSIGVSESISLDNPVTFAKIRAQNSQENIPMQKKKISLVLENKAELERDISYEYNIVARVCYPYHTTSIIKVETMSENEFLILNEQNKFRQFPVTADTTSGPVYIEVTSKQPQVISSNGKIHLKLKITNIGGGTPVMEGNCANMLEPKGDAKSVINNINKVSFDSMDCYYDMEWGEGIYLKQGKSSEIEVTCDVDGVSKKEHMLRVSVYYDYYFDSKKINLKVRGTKTIDDRGSYVARLDGVVGTEFIEDMGLGPFIDESIPIISVQMNEGKSGKNNISSQRVDGLKAEVDAKSIVVLGKYVEKYEGEEAEEKVLLKEVKNLYIADSGLLDVFTLDDLNRINQKVVGYEGIISKQYYDYNIDAKTARANAQGAVDRRGGELSDYLPKKYTENLVDELGIVATVTDCNAVAGTLRLSHLDTINGMYIKSSTREEDRLFEWQTLDTKITRIKVPGCKERTISELTGGKLDYISLDQIYMNKLHDLSFIGAKNQYVDYVLDSTEDDEKKIVGYLKKVTTEGYENCVSEEKKSANESCMVACANKSYSQAGCFRIDEGLHIANLGKYGYICYNDELYMATNKENGIKWDMGCKGNYQCICYDTVEKIGDEAVLFCPQA